jgi:membrane protease YdiL (CAAX protease family)
MEFEPNTPSPVTPDTRFGIILRVAFFVATVLLGLTLFPVALLAALGPVIAATIGLFLAGILANWLTMRVFDRRPFSDIGVETNRRSLRNFITGLLLSAAAAFLMLMAPILAGAGHLVPHSHAGSSWSGDVDYFLLLLCGAAGEELIFRGYAFQLLVDKIGPFATVLPVAVIFGLAHSSNPHASALGVVNTIIWGIVLGYAFLRSHDLWLPIGLHYGWNAILPAFGVNLSGLTIDLTRYTYRWDLSPLWSGGGYGPEGGLLTTIFAIALFYVLTRIPVAPQHAAIAQILNDM